MKLPYYFILSLLCTLTSVEQEKNIETLSVSVHNLIPFIVENYSSSNDEQVMQSKNILILLQTPSGEFSTEDGVLYKYAFRLLSERLSDTDLISIVAFSGFNGIAMNATSPKDIKSILYTIDNLKSSIKTFHPDGIELAYDYAKENFVESAQNTVVMVRNANINSSSPNTSDVIEANERPKKNHSAILLTAIALLPEIISVIKD